MRKALKRAAKILMDIHDGGSPPKVRRRPRGLCHCLQCCVERHEDKPVHILVGDA